jgi:hypothetical protein
MTTVLSRAPRKTYRDLTNIASIPVPQATDTFRPVSQSDLWSCVLISFKQCGYRLDNELHQVHHKRPLFVSSIDVMRDGLPGTDTGGGVKWTIAVMNSYDKSMSARIIFGGRVFVCSNGLIIADRVLRTKHTTHIWSRLPFLVQAAVDAFEGEVHRYHTEQHRLKEYQIGTAEIAAFTVDIARRGILPKAQMLDFYEEAVKPSFDYQTPNLCLWNLQAAYTHLAKGMNPMERPRRVMAFDHTLRETYAMN